MTFISGIVGEVILLAKLGSHSLLCVKASAMAKALSQIFRNISSVETV